MEESTTAANEVIDWSRQTEVIQKFRMDIQFEFKKHKKVQKITPRIYTL